MANDEDRRAGRTGCRRLALLAALALGGSARATHEIADTSSVGTDFQGYTKVYLGSGENPISRAGLTKTILDAELLQFDDGMIATAAHAGELKINGSVTSTLVEVLAGTTLSDTGTLGCDVTVAGVRARSPAVA